MNDFYDLFAGENAFWEPQYEDLAYLPVSGTGHYTGGPQNGLQSELTVLINGDWGHFKKDESIAPPRLSVDQLISNMKDALSRKAVPLLDVEVYQDGTASPETLRELEAMRKSIRGR